jgi:hypothetical protein
MRMLCTWKSTEKEAEKLEVLLCWLNVHTLGNCRDCKIDLNTIAFLCIAAIIFANIQRNYMHCRA